MRSLIFLCTIYASQVAGTSQQPDPRLEIYFDEVLFKTQCDLLRRNPNGRKIYLRAALQSDSGNFIDLRADPYGLFLGLDYTLKKVGWCSTRKEQEKNTLQCSVIFDGIRIVLPRVADDATQYVVHAKIGARVVLQERLGTSFMMFKRFALTQETYTMMDSNYGLVSHPVQYSLKEGPLQNLRGVLHSKFVTFLGDNGQLRDALDTALRAVRKPVGFNG
uniref:Putative secreted protein n=1 Tax=Ixodes ricinus TaxID=34613 RepID=A0A090XET7_IXORI